MARQDLRVAWFDVAPTDEDVQQVAEWAVTQMESGYTFKEIKGPQKQVINIQKQTKIYILYAKIFLLFIAQV